MYSLTDDFQSCCLPGICFHLSSDTLTENTVYKQAWVDQKRLSAKQAHTWRTDEPCYLPCHFLYLSPFHLPEDCQIFLTNLFSSTVSFFSLLITFKHLTRYQKPSVSMVSICTLKNTNAQFFPLKATNYQDVTFNVNHETELQYKPSIFSSPNNSCMRWTELPLRTCFGYNYLSTSPSGIVLKTYGSFLNWYYIILFLKSLVTEIDKKLMTNLEKLV